MARAPQDWHVKRKFRCKVWRPETPERQLNARFSATPRRLKLKVSGKIGSFDEASKTLWGDCNGEPLTFLESMLLRASPGDPDEQEFTMNGVLHGRHLSSGDSPTFGSATARIDALPDWFWPQKWFNLEVGSTSWECRGTPSIGRLEIRIDAASTCEITCGAKLHSSDMEARFSLSTTAKLKSDVARGYSWHEDQLQWLKLFFSIGVGALLDFEELAFQDASGPGKASLYRRPTRQSRWKTINHQLLPLPRPAIAQPEQLIQNWFTKREDLEVPAHMLQDLWFRDRARIASELDYLALTQALEAYHKRTRSEPKSQRARLQELADELPADLWDRLNVPASDWVQSTLEKRNSLTHRSPSDGRLAVDQALISDTSRLEVVLQALLLTHIGLDEETLLSACTRMSAWRTGGGRSWERVKILSL